MNAYDATAREFLDEAAGLARSEAGRDGSVLTIATATVAVVNALFGVSERLDRVIAALDRLEQR
jgi:hypothetical protein